MKQKIDISFIKLKQKQYLFYILSAFNSRNLYIWWLPKIVIIIIKAKIKIIIENIF